MTKTKKRAVCYSFSLNDDQRVDAMGYLRIIAPYTKIGYEIIPGIENHEVKFDPIESSEFIIIQRNFPDNYSAYEQVIKIAHQFQKPVIFEIDDLFFHLPENHPDRLNYNFTSSLLPILQAITEANFVTVTTPKLKQALLQFNKNIEVLPNYLDDEIWKMRNPVSNVDNSQNIVIGYMGTNSHQVDLLYILPALQELITNYSNRIKFRFWGVKPPEDFLSHPQVEWIPFYSIDYQKFAQYFQTQNADIFISPLINNDFNKCKSSIKFFEYSSLGIPGVYSSIEPYSDIIENGTTGLLAESVQDWKACLVNLIENPNLRFEIAKNAQEFVKNNYLLSENTNIIENFLHKVNYSSKNEDLYTTEVLKSINKQNHEYIETLRKNIHDKDQIINQLGKEIQSYFLSASWQITRPLRKINQKLFEKKHV